MSDLERFEREAEYFGRFDYLQEAFGDTMVDIDFFSDEEDEQP